MSLIFFLSDSFPSLITTVSNATRPRTTRRMRARKQTVTKRRMKKQIVHYHTVNSFLWGSEQLAEGISRKSCARAQATNITLTTQIFLRKQRSTFLSHIVSLEEHEQYATHLSNNTLTLIAHFCFLSHFSLSGV
jgi:hypothetical protein